MTDLIIRGVDERFAEMVRTLHDAYKRGLKFHFDADFSGNPGEIKYFYSKIDASDLYAIISKRVTSEKTAIEEHKS